MNNNVYFFGVTTQSDGNGYLQSSRYDDLGIDNEMETTTMYNKSRSKEEKKTEKMMILLCDCCYVLWINNLFVEEDKIDEMIVELI